MVAKFKEQTNELTLRLAAALSVASLMLVACVSPLPAESTPTRTTTSTPTSVATNTPTAEGIGALVDLTTDPTVVADAQAIRLVFQSFQEALLDSNGDLASSLVDQQTNRYHEAMRLLALYGTVNDVRRLRPIDKAMILTIRQMTTVDSLLAMDGRDVFANAVNVGWIGAGAVVQSDLGDLTIVGNTAVAPVRVGEQIAPFEWIFNRETGNWTLNLVSINEASNLAITQVIANSGLSEEEFLLRMVGSMSGRQPSETIFEPMTGRTGAAQVTPTGGPVPQAELGDVDAYLTRGTTLGKQGRLVEAIADFTEAIELDPDSASAYLRRGEAYLRTGRPADAIADLTKAIAIDPENATSYTYLGGIQQVHGDLEDAAANLTKAIKIDPYNALAYYIRGIVFSEQGKLEEAIADFSTAIDLEPNYTAAYLRRGFAYGPQGRLEEAIADFNKAIEIDQSLARAYYGRGLAYSQQGDSTAAIREFRRYLQIAPDATDRAEVEQRIQALESTQ